MLVSLIVIGSLWAAGPANVYERLAEQAALALVPGLILVAFAEEAFFRGVLPEALLPTVVRRVPITASLEVGRAALVSQGVFALVHLSTLAPFGTWALVSRRVWIVLGFKLVFGLLMLAAAWMGNTLIERVTIHALVNLLFFLAPASAITGGMRMLLVAAVAVTAVWAAQRVPLGANGCAHAAVNSRR